MTKSALSVHDRFFQYVRKTEDGDCWEWTAGKSRGYGTFCLDGKQISSHRMAWLLEKGEIPAGFFVCHHCDNRGCVRVSHLFLGTHQDNMDDMFAKRRDRRLCGQDHPRVSLNDAEVKRMLDIWEKNRPFQRELAEQFGVAREVVKDILRGATRRDVTGGVHRGGYRQREITFAGRTLSVAEWSKETGLPRAVILGRLSYGWSTEKVLTKPLRKVTSPLYHRQQADV
jgi:hypothetical protein